MPKMLRILSSSIGLLIILMLGHLSVTACTCPGVNPDVYPPDFEVWKKYFRQDFKGAAFTGKVLTVIKMSGEKTDIGDNILEITVKIDRIWLGRKQREMTFYASDNPCGTRFRQNESYFFIPSLENNRLYIAPCTYGTYSSKPDGNYVELMERILGKGKKFGKP
jgi:hypothetical protein